MTDEKLASAFQSGNWKAFEELYQRYENLVKSISYNPVTKSKTKTAYNYDSQEQKEEVESEIKVQFIELSLKYDPTKAKFSTYISRNLKWHGSNFMRKEKNKNTEYDDDTYEPPIEEIPTYFDEELDWMKEQIKILPGRQRQVMELTLEGHSISAITEILCLKSHKEVSNHKRRAIESIKKRLREF